VLEKTVFRIFKQFLGAFLFIWEISIVQFVFANRRKPVGMSGQSPADVLKR